MGFNQHPLFDRWPQLERQVKYNAYASLPTPVFPLNNIGPNAWVKRDDLSHHEYGGNKVRKLEFIIPDLILKNNPINNAHKMKVVTFGGVGTNSGVATAMVCRDFQIPCTIFLFDQPASTSVAKNLKLMSAYSATLVHYKSPLTAGARFFINPQRFNPNYYFLFAGCTTTKSVFGYVNAAIELMQQIDSGICPLPKKIIVATGSCSTVAGLSLGFSLLNVDIEIIAVRVAPSRHGPFPGTGPTLIRQLMQGALTLLAKEYPEVKHTPLKLPTLLDNYFGDGYGMPTDKGGKAVEFAKSKEALALEQTYTGKAFAAFLDLQKNTNEPILFWNTYNSVDTSDREKQFVRDSIPKSLRHYLNETEYTDHLRL